MFSKRFKREFENNRQVYEELAEKKTIEILGLTDKEILTAKAFETTKAVELNNLKHKMYKKQNQKMTWRKVLFGSFD